MGVAATAGLLVGSVWVEDRYPSDEPRRARWPRFQAVVTRPVAAAASRLLSSTLRHQLEDRLRGPGLPPQERIARSADETLPMADRMALAFSLARDGSPEAVAALRRLLAAATRDEKARLAWLIGSAGNPAAMEWLRPLLDDPDDRVVRGAIRGLAVLGGTEVTERLAAFLHADSRESVRVEAAAALATIGTPAARDALAEQLGREHATAVERQLLASLGTFAFGDVEELFTGYLAPGKKPDDLRVAAAEALVDSTPDAVPFLTELAAGDRDAEVRASAAWAISGQPAVPNLAPVLADLAAREAEPDVRRRLYEAMLPQAQVPAAGVWELVRTETDPAARIAGFNALGHAVGKDPASPVCAAFDAEVVPELHRLATSANTANLQMRAVFALRRAGTPAAQQALADIARTAVPVIAKAARHGLQTPP